MLRTAQYCDECTLCCIMLHHCQGDGFLSCSETALDLIGDTLADKMKDILLVSYYIPLSRIFLLQLTVLNIPNER